MFACRHLIFPPLRGLALIFREPSELNNDSPIRQDAKMLRFSLGTRSIKNVENKLLLQHSHDTQDTTMVFFH